MIIRTLSITTNELFLYICLDDKYEQDDRSVVECQKAEVPMI